MVVKVQQTYFGGRAGSIRSILKTIAISLQFAIVGRLNGRPVRSRRLVRSFLCCPLNRCFSL